MKSDEQNFDKFRLVFIGKVLQRKVWKEKFCQIADHSVNSSKFSLVELLHYTVYALECMVGLRMLATNDKSLK